MALRRLCAILAWGLFLGFAQAEDKPSSGAPAAKISYYQQIRPVFQANCTGCHQPAKASGEYQMASFDALLKGGESGSKAIVPGKPDDSYLIDEITPTKGKAEMPKEKAPLADSDIALVRRWISEGAVDDTPENARQRFDLKHPPIYSRPPVIASLDFSLDGKLLAVAGFHEVLLLKSDGSDRVARLIGMSDRVESVRFSPNGSQLMAVGGNPCRMGEVQIWDVANRSLAVSTPITADTLYGGSWSPDGSVIAFGAADRALRAIEAKTGKQVVYMAAHDDWIRGTVFSADGKSILTVSSDMTVKMTDVATQRFLGNVTTHTPGVLRGGMLAIDRHPKRKEVIVGSADGSPKLFKMEVTAAPASGGNPNQIREYDAMPGRIFDIRFHPDGMHFFAASSLDGKGQIRSYETDSGKTAWQLDVPECGLYAIACSPDGKTLATTGADGRIRLIDAVSGKSRNSFLPVDIAPAAAAGAAWFAGASPVMPPSSVAPMMEKPRISNSKSQISDFEPRIVRLEAEPVRIRIVKPTDYIQFVATGTQADGSRIDATGMAKWTIEGSIGQVSSHGMFTPSQSGQGRIVGELSGQRVEVPVEIVEGAGAYVPNFIRDVEPVMSRLGCNAGTCHGAAKGKNGFKLSLRGYDPVVDYRALTDDLAARRTTMASPDDSLMLLKPTAAVPHVGGRVTTPESPEYRIVRRWIAEGCKLDLSTLRVVRIEVFPKLPVVESVGGSQQMRVVATYADGTDRDVTREAFIESGNTEVATADRMGVITAIRRGEAPVLARYEGSYAATTLTVMGDRSGFVWKSPETWGRIDELVAAKWERMKILPSDVCNDAEFIRRVSLDLTGLPPTSAELKAFTADDRDMRTKRNELIDKLIGSNDFIEHWTNKWADLLQVNRKHLGPEGAAAYRAWIRKEVAANTPYQQFVQKILTATGSNKENPAASYFKILRVPQDTMENTTHLFLAVRFNCNKCHDHPFERWTQDQYYQTAAYFARVDLKEDPISKGQKIGGTDVEGGKPLYEIIGDKADGEILHDRTKAVTAPKLPYMCNYVKTMNASRRQEFSAWLTSPDNSYFAKSYVNRLWGYLLGAGIIEPLDDIRAGNPATNPELLDYLTSEFIHHDFDMRYMLQMICRSRTYQLSIENNRWNEDDKINYSHALARRLPAEVLYDAIHRATGAISNIPGVPRGTRAEAIPDSGVNLPDGFLTNLGRPPRESACECERTTGLQLGPVMALISGPTVEAAIADPANDLAKLVAKEPDDKKLIGEIYMRVLSRPATSKEIDLALADLRNMPEGNSQLSARLDKLEKEAAAGIAEREKQRQAGIAQAKTELDGYEKTVAAALPDLERKRKDRIDKAESALHESESKLPERLAKWEHESKSPIAWTSIDPQKMTSTNKAKLTKQDDGSIVASGSNGKTTYVITAPTDLSGITGIRLEALADDKLPGKGPGRAPNGNFVVSQFLVDWAAKKTPKQKTRVALQNAQADFSQADYEVSKVIDATPSTGWAVVPRTGENHTAVFETHEDIGKGPGIVTFTLLQNFPDGQHTLGRFRISLTKAPRPIVLDVIPKNIHGILMVESGKRTPAQKKELLEYYRNVDPEVIARRREIETAKAPLPMDPKLAQLRDALTEAGKPLSIDPKLVQLRADAALSIEQMKNFRLTFAQDLAWALINSPAFLFNR